MQFTYLHSFTHCSSFAQCDGNFPPNLEEVEKTEDLRKDNKAVGSGELLSRVQKLEDELKDSEQKRMDLIHDNTALQIKLKATQEEEGRTHLEMASLEERLLSVSSSQVRRMMVLRHQTDRQEG